MTTAAAPPTTKAPDTPPGSAPSPTEAAPSAAIVPAASGPVIEAQLVPAGYSRALEPRDFTEACRVATTLADSKAYGLSGTADALARIMQGRELGMSAMQSIANIYSFDGKYGLYAEAIEGLCLRHPELEKWDWIERSDRGAKLAIKRKGRTEQIIEFNEADALRAELLIRDDKGGVTATKDNWRRYPRRMYVARCRSEGASLVFPDVVRGFMSVEEMQDSPPRAPTIEVVHAPSPASTAQADLATLLKAQLGMVTNYEGVKAARETIEAHRAKDELTGAYLKEVVDLYNEVVKKFPKPKEAKEKPASASAPAGAQGSLLGGQPAAKG